jgi:hypothetical protein
VHENRAEIVALYDERFFRMWEFYARAHSSRLITLSRLVSSRSNSWARPPGCRREPSAGRRGAAAPARAAPAAFLHGDEAVAVGVDPREHGAGPLDHFGAGLDPVTLAALRVGRDLRTLRRWRRAAGPRPAEHLLHIASIRPVVDRR